MADTNKIKNEVIQEDVVPQSPQPQGSDNQKKKNGFLFGLFALITALAIMAAVIGGAFFIAVRNNISGITDKYGSDIREIPILRMALPKVPDPMDPNKLTREQLISKYNEFRKKIDELDKKLVEENKKSSELQKTNDEQDKLKVENAQLKKDLEAVTAKYESEKKQLAEDKKAIASLIASGDKAGFKAYYEKMDKENAKNLYAEILEEQKASDDEKKFAKLYEVMDASDAASIFEQLGAGKMDLTVRILKNMKKESVAGVMSEMTPEFAAKVSEKLSNYYLATPTPKV